MGITSHTQMHAHKHTDISRDFFFSFFSLRWRKVNGCNRKEEDPVETHASCFISSHSSLSAIFFRSHSDFMTYSVSVGRNNVVPVTACFSCPPEMRHNTQCRISNPAASSFFHWIWSELKTVQPGQLILFTEAETCHCLKTCVCLFHSYLFRGLDHQIKTMSHLLRFSGWRVLQSWVIF